MNNLYEQKYKEALGWMQKLYDGLHGATKEDAEHYFPELKYSGDEKIRKQILSFLKEFECDHYSNLDFSSWIAWLEKQGGQNTNPDVPTREVILSIWDLGNEWKELTNGCISTEHGTQLNYIQKHWHESECSLKEKQGKKKTIYKFNQGDWVIDKQGIVHQIKNVIENMTDHTYGYDIVGGGYFNDEVEGIRLWTIDDAKDGDVIVCDSKHGRQEIGIVKRYVAKYGMCFVAYCFVDWDGIFRVSEYMGSRNIHPATKEQRDALFAKMKDEGYEWDAEKKELKRIEI